MDRYPLIVSKIMSTPWLITEEGMQAILDILNRRLDGEVLTKDEIRVRLGDNAGRERNSYSSSHNGVGVISLEGPMFPRANLFTELSGATSIEQAQSEFRAMMNDDSIGSILLSFDSPGGSSEGIPEFAQDIFDARESGKRIVSIANMAANSAAYYLASQAQEMYATPSGQVGSIGVLLVTRDNTRQLEAQGIDQTVVTAGRLKHVGWTPMTAEGRQYLQGYVDSTYEDFVSAVARGRGTDEDTVKNGFGHAGIVTPKQGLEEGMIDGIATFGEVLNDMSNGGDGSAVNAVTSGTAASGRLTTKASYDADKEHSEPGTGQGGEPTPREPPEKDDPAIKGGWRRDPPPIAYETEERSEMNREYLEQLATLVGATFDASMSDDDLAELVKKEVGEFVEPIQTASASASAARDFARDYPEQASKMAELEAESRQSKAVSFAENYARFEGTEKGFSTLVREKLQDAHVKLSDRVFTHSDLTELVDSMASKDAIVDWSENGSARTTESPILRAGAGRQEIRKQYADEIKRLMEEDQLDRKAAQRVLSEQNPDLAMAYIGSSSAN